MQFIQVPGPASSPDRTIFSHSRRLPFPLCTPPGLMLLSCKAPALCPQLSLVVIGAAADGKAGKPLMAAAWA